MLKGFKIKSELSEKQIEADVSAYLGWITPIGRSSPFRLIDIDEEVTGADKRIDLVIPMYLQFKVSEGLKPLNSKFNLSLLPFTPLQKIRRFRKRLQLKDNPTLYFKLRIKARTATEFQHNILLRLNGIENVSAFYVAPLELEKTKYENRLYSSMKRFSYRPFEDRIISIHQNNWLSQLGFVPFLRGHISIFPHEKVNTSKHHYSFDQTGCEIGWHSPDYYKQNLQLSSTIKNIFDNATSNKYYWQNPKEYLEVIQSKFDFFSTDKNSNNDFKQLEEIQRFGQELYQRYEIRQFLITTTYEQIEQLRKEK